jgi:diguanylate cyclase (GGDEF)-like protein
MRAQTIALGDAGEPARVMGTFRDISERKEAEFRLASASDLLRRTGKMARVGGFQLEVPSMAMRWTDEMFELYDLPTRALPGYDESLASYTAESRARVVLAISEAIEEGKPWSLKAELVTATGRRTWVRMQGEAVTGDNGEVVRLVGALQDVTELEKYEGELRRANEQLARLTVTDGLTGVGNRRLFDQTLEKEWQRCARHHVPLALLMVDIDHFKLYNDRHGHIAGDAALTQVAHILADCVQRSGELVARYGGEEFVILLPGIDRDGAAAVAHACQLQMARADIAHPASPSAGALTLSIGVASVVPDATQAPAALLNAADRALYMAKAAGRNRYELAVTTPQQRPLATVGGLTGTE